VGWYRQSVLRSFYHSGRPMKRSPHTPLLHAAGRCHERDRIAADDHGYGTGFSLWSIFFRDDSSLFMFDDPKAHTIPALDATDRCQS
jgi:hypothetical protein